MCRPRHHISAFDLPLPEAPSSSPWRPDVPPKRTLTGLPRVPNPSRNSRSVATWPLLARARRHRAAIISTGPTAPRTRRRASPPLSRSRRSSVNVHHVVKTPPEPIAIVQLANTPPTAIERAPAKVMGSAHVQRRFAWTSATRATSATPTPMTNPTNASWRWAISGVEAISSSWCRPGPDGPHDSHHVIKAFKTDHRPFGLRQLVGTAACARKPQSPHLSRRALSASGGCCRGCRAAVPRAAFSRRQSPVKYPAFARASARR